MGAIRTAVGEPAAAACVGAALVAGRPVQVGGCLSTCADLLSCGLASAGALQILLGLGCGAITVPKDALAAAPGRLAAIGGPQTTPSGAAGLAGLLTAAGDDLIRARLDLDRTSRVLLLLTEGLVEPRR